MTRLVRIALRWILLALLIPAITLPQIAPGFAAGQLQFGTPPKTLGEAKDTLLERRDMAIKQLACGDEVDLLAKLDGGQGGPFAAMYHVMAKMMWLLTRPAAMGFPPTPPAPAPAPAPAPGGEDGFVPPHFLPEFRDDDPAGFLRVATGGGDDSLVATCSYDIPPVGGKSVLDPLQQILNVDPGIQVPILDPTTGKPVTNPGPIAQTVPMSIDQANQDMVRNVGQAGQLCANVISVTPGQDSQQTGGQQPGGAGGGPLKSPPSPDPNAQPPHLTFTVTPDCMRAQINSILMNFQEGDTQLGTSGLPCHGNVLDKTNGDWDPDVRDLTRIFFLDQLNKDQHILDPATVKHIQDDLLTADGGPGLASYALYQCGDTERDTGTAQERLARRNWLTDTLGDVLKDGENLQDWLLSHIPLPEWLIRVLAAYVALSSGGFATALSALMTASAVEVNDVRFTETENHRLMIETSRYLNDQIIIADLRSQGTDPGPFTDDLANVKDFLLGRFKDIMSNDFIEFNALPYGRYSLFSILNIAQFADDKDLQEGARMVLDYTTAKAAIGMDAARRIVPYRRHLNSLEKRGNTLLYFTLGDSDTLMPLMLLFTGQTQHLQSNYVPPEADSHMVYYASAMLDPNVTLDSDRLIMPDVIMEAAIDRTQAYEQRIHHAGAEIYSSGDGWLVTAGGILTGPAYQVAIPQLGHPDDRGAAWPTTLILSASGFDATPLKDFLRIDGLAWHFTDPLLGDGDSFDGNLCVGLGFACGFNIEFPANAAGLGKGAPNVGIVEQIDDPNGWPHCADNEGNGWTFFDTQDCYPGDTALGSRALVAVFSQKCQPGVASDCNNFGLFEVVSFSDPALASVPEAQRFDEFKRRVQANNSAGFTASIEGQVAPLPTLRLQFQGTYTTVKEQSSGAPHRIEFEAEFSTGSASSRIVSVDGTDRPNFTSWNLAEGDFIRGNSKGAVDIGWANRPGAKTLTLNIEDQDFPFHVPAPPQ